MKTRSILILYSLGLFATLSLALFYYCESGAFDKWLNRKAQNSSKYKITFDRLNFVVYEGGEFQPGVVVHNVEAESRNPCSVLYKFYTETVFLPIKLDGLIDFTSKVQVRLGNIKIRKVKVNLRSKTQCGEQLFSSRFVNSAQNYFEDKLEKEILRSVERYDSFHFDKVEVSLDEMKTPLATLHDLTSEVDQETLSLKLKAQASVPTFKEKFSLFFDVKSKYLKFQMLNDEVVLLNLGVRVATMHLDSNIVLQKFPFERFVSDLGLSTEEESSSRDLLLSCSLNLQANLFKIQEGVLKLGSCNVQPEESSQVILRGPKEWVIKNFTWESFLSRLKG